LLRPPNLASTIAVRATGRCGAGFCTTALAIGARLLSVDLHLFGAAEHCFLKGDLEIQPLVRAPRGSPSRGTVAAKSEQVPKDVLKATKTGESLKATLVQPGVTKTIISRASFPIAKYLVGFVDLFEACFGIFVFAYIWVVFAGEPSVRPTYLILGCVPRDSQYLIVVTLLLGHLCVNPRSLASTKSRLGTCCYP